MHLIIFSFSIINVALILALYIRYLVVGLVSAFFLLIAAAALFPPTRDSQQCYSPMEQ